RPICRVRPAWQDRQLPAVGTLYLQPARRRCVPARLIRKGIRGPVHLPAFQENEARVSIPRRPARRAPLSRLDVVFSSRKQAGSHDKVFALSWRNASENELYTALASAATEFYTLSLQEF